MQWLIQNWGTIVAGLAVLGVVAAIIAVKIRASKKGKSSCGCGCANCAMKDCCHGKTVSDRKRNE